MHSRQELQLFSSLWYLLLNVNGCTLRADLICISHALITKHPQHFRHEGLMAKSRLFRKLLLSQRWDNLVAVPGKGGKLRREFSLLTANRRTALAGCQPGARGESVRESRKTEISELALGRNERQRVFYGEAYVSGRRSSLS